MTTETTTVSANLWVLLSPLANLKGMPTFLGVHQTNVSRIDGSEGVIVTVHVDRDALPEGTLRTAQANGWDAKSKFGMVALTKIVGVTKKVDRVAEFFAKKGGAS